MLARSVLVAGLVLSFLVPARADNFKVSSGEASDLTDAIADASAGDTITVSGGPYVGNFTVPAGKDGLVIKGKAIIDAQGGSNAFLINSSDVEISGFTIRHSTSHGIQGPSGGPPKLLGLRITGCTFIDCGSAAVNVTADDCTIEKSFAEGCDGGFDITGANAIVTRCTVIFDGDDGVVIAGPDAQVISCVIDVIEDGNGINVSGLNALILKNRVNNTDGEGIDLNNGDGSVIESNTLTNITDVGIDSTGDNIQILKNKLTWCTSEGIDSSGVDVVISQNRVSITDNDGIRSSGDSVTITKNRVDGVNDDADGISVSGANALIESNIVQNVAETGIALSGNNGQLIKNRVFRTAEDDSGFEITGNGNTLEGNLAKDCDDVGFAITGDSNELTGNKALRCLDNGFVISGLGSENNVLEGNSALLNEGDGIENGGVGTTLSGNKSLKNQQDLSNRTIAGATITDDGGNTFVTGGFTSEPILP